MQDDNQPVSSAPALSQPYAQTDSSADASTTDSPAAPHSFSGSDIPSSSDTQAPEIKPTSSPTSTSPDLDDLKQKALKDLTPLLGNLDQSPEEKYKTLMMVIQASDKQDLLKDAYEAAQKITDNAARADALVGILNEINYFSKGD